MASRSSRKAFRTSVNLTEWQIRRVWKIVEANEASIAWFLRQAVDALLGAKYHVGKAGWEADDDESALMQEEQVMAKVIKEGKNAIHTRWPAGRFWPQSVLKDVPVFTKMHNA